MLLIREYRERELNQHAHVCIHVTYMILQSTLKRTCPKRWRYHGIFH